MKAGLRATFLTIAALAVALPSHAQGVRSDVLWARSTGATPITLDGNLNEAAWAQAESVIVQWAVDNGSPGSGFKPEGGLLPTDPTFATLKFLTYNGQLYMGARVRDNSVGGSELFNRFDGFLMAIQDHNSLGRPTGPMEHFYSWYWLGDPTPRAVGKQPSFIGAWGNNPPLPTRTAEQIANWDAVTIVTGEVNRDTTNAGAQANDGGYVTEMRFNVAADGYNITQVNGDVVEFNVSIYDCDRFWPLNVSGFAANRTWWQGPWGNVSWYHEVKIHARPDVTTASGPVPIVGPDVRIKNAGGYAAPTIDGQLNETVWQLAPSFDIRYGDDALRNTYPGVGPFRSGQYQPEVNAGLAAVLDPGDATVKWFYKDDKLYLGFDVRDQVVQYVATEDRWDGFAVTINEKVTRGPDNELQSRALNFQVGPGGTALSSGYLPYLKDTLGGAALALVLKPGTTVDTVGANTDQGYVAEMWIDLTKLSYPAGLGDRIVWLGITLYDGDSFTPFTDSYGTRTWYFRERAGLACPVWAYLDPAQFVVGVDDLPGNPGPSISSLRGNAPNPFGRNTTVRYALAQPSKVTMEVYDLQGRMVDARVLGRQDAGEQHFVFQRGTLGSGLYMYRLRLADPGTGVERETLSGKMMLLQ